MLDRGLSVVVRLRDGELESWACDRAMSGFSGSGCCGGGAGGSENRGLDESEPVNEPESEPFVCGCLGASKSSTLLESFKSDLDSSVSKNSPVRERSLV